MLKDTTKDVPDSKYKIPCILHISGFPEVEKGKWKNGERTVS